MQKKKKLELWDQYLVQIRSFKNIYLKQFVLVK